MTVAEGIDRGVRGGVKGAKGDDTADETEDRAEMRMAGTAVPHGLVANAVFLSRESEGHKGGGVEVGDGARDVVNTIFYTSIRKLQSVRHPFPRISVRKLLRSAALSTMGNDPVPPTLAELDRFLDPTHSIYGFATEEWIASPPYIAPEGVDSARIYQRLGHADAFRQTGTPIAWHRYVILGFYVFDDCSHFDRYWRQFISKRLICSKMIWYNYMYHVDHNLDIHPKLQAWAQEVARPYLAAVEHSFLTLDTNRLTWNTLMSTSITEPEDFSDQFTTVGTKKSTKTAKSAMKSTPQPLAAHVGPPPPNRSGKSTSSTLSQLSSLGKASTKRSATFATPLTSSDSTNARSNPNPILTVPSLKAWTEQPTTRKFHKPGQDDDCDMLSDDKNSAYQSTLNNKPMNDGTNRLTFRWKPTSDFKDLSANPTAWTSKLHTILQLLFTDCDGLFYRWESTDLTACTSISTLTPSVLRDFISPKITTLNGLSTFVFGLRFGFAAKTHIAWRMQEHLNDLLKTHGITVTISNSSTSSGRLVIAGYILFKAPNTTHRTRYLQSLRNTMPDNTPFFDIILHRRTPTDDNFHHLVVRCGENHITPLTTALGRKLTGKSSAFFLPRLAFGKLTTDQIKKYFAMHQSYVRSLKMIQISPSITHLDIARVEHMPDGSTLERSTREWAMQLTLADGITSARCDIVNGSSDHNTYLLVPTPHLDDIKAAFKAYQLRLNLLGERETRFRDSLPSLPSVIHVDVTTQANLDFLEHMSSDEKWRRAPASVRGGVSTAPSFPAVASRPAQSTTSSMDGDSVNAPADVMWPPPALPGDGGSTTSKPKGATKSSGRPSAFPYKNPQSDDQTAASQRSDSSTITALLARIHKMEEAHQAFQIELKKIATTSAEQYADVTERLRSVDTLSETIVHTLTNHQSAAMSSMKTEFEGMLSGFFTSFSSRQQDPSPATTAPMSVATNPVQVDLEPQLPLAVSLEPHVDHLNDIPSAISSAAALPSGSASVESGNSFGSTRSYSSDVELPQQKKSRGLQADMSHLSLQPSDTESVYSDLGDAVYPAPTTFANDPSPWSPTIDDPLATHVSDVQPPPNNVALPDLDNQYKAQLAPDGGATG